MAKVTRKYSGMTAVQEKVFLGKVLAEVNWVRGLLGLKPITKLPKGDLGKELSCPQALALHGDDPADTCKVRVGDGINVDRTLVDKYIPVKGGGEYFISSHVESLNIPMPPNMSQFIDLFDDGKLPQFAVVGDSD